MTPEPAGSRVSLWGESPVWHHGLLYHVDINGHGVIAYDPSSGYERFWPLGQRVGFVVPRRNGGLVYGGDHGIFLLDPDSGRTEPLVDPEPDTPDNRFNDGKCSPDGRLFAGTISLARDTGAATLYRLDADLSLSRAFGPVTTSNGLAWSPDGTLCYYIDTPTREVREFRYDGESGALLDPRVAFRTDTMIQASPDGMAMDADGMLWIAFCHGACVKQINPRDGRELAHIAMPAGETTSVAFGGVDLRDLYITTGVDPKRDDDMGGRLFVVRDMPVAGCPVAAFAG